VTVVRIAYARRCRLANRDFALLLLSSLSSSLICILLSVLALAVLTCRRVEGVCGNRGGFSGFLNSSLIRSRQA